MWHSVKRRAVISLQLGCVCVCVVIFLLRGALCLYIMQRFVHWQHHMNVKAVICLILIMINRLDYSRAAIDIKKL